MDALLAQLRRGTLEYCVLAMLKDRERYAASLVAELGRDQVLVASQGTVYPLLSRLRRDGMVSSMLRESPVGPARRYYRLTPKGRTAVDKFTKQWAVFKKAVDEILEKDGSQ